MPQCRGCRGCVKKVACATMGQTVQGDRLWTPQICPCAHVRHRPLEWFGIHTCCMELMHHQTVSLSSNTVGISFQPLSARWAFMAASESSLKHSITRYKLQTWHLAKLRHTRSIRDREFNRRKFTGFTVFPASVFSHLWHLSSSLPQVAAPMTCVVARLTQS